MKVSILIAIIGVLGSASAQARSVHVRAYVRPAGTVVMPHLRTERDARFWNNWSTKGNVNPYTGRPGTRVSPPRRR